MPVDLITDCVQQLLETVNSVEALEDRVLYAYAEDDLAKWWKQIGTPCGVLLYTGTNALEEAGKLGTKGVLTCDLLIVVGGESNFGQADNKPVACEYLGQVRRALRQTISPSGHRWRFLSEGLFPIEQSKGPPLLGYLQRWETIVSMM